MRPRPLAAISAPSNLLAVSFLESQARGGARSGGPVSALALGHDFLGLRFCGSEFAQTSL